MPKRRYLLTVLFGDIVKKWNKLKKAKLTYTTRVKKVPIKKKDKITLVFTSKSDYQKAKIILGNPCK